MSDPGAPQEPEAPARPFRRRVLINTASTGAANAWAMVVTLVALPVLLGGLGPAAFGTWVLLSTFSAVNGWLSLADLGVATATTRAVAESASHEDRRAIATRVGSSLALFLALGLVCALAMATVGRVVLPALFDTPARLVDDLEFAIVAFAVQLVPDLLLGAANSALEGLQRVDLSRAADALRRTAVAAATCLAALGGGGLRGVALASLVVSALASIVALVLLWVHLPDRRLRFDRGEARSLLAYGKTVAVLRPFGVIQRTMDRLIVGAILGPAPVAFVEIATQIQNGADAVLSASSYAVIPSASWLRARDDVHTLRELLLTGTKYSLLVTLPFVTAPAILAGPLVRLWVGPAYAAAAGLAVVGLIYIAMTAPIQVGSNLLVGTGRAGAVLRAVVGAVLVNLVASVVLVHLVGTVGAFLGTLIGTCFLVIPLRRSALEEVGADRREFVRTSVLPSLAPNLALAAVAGAVVLAPLPDLTTLVLGGGVGALVYAAVAWRWSFERSELAGLRGTMSRSGPLPAGSSAVPAPEVVGA